MGTRAPTWWVDDAAHTLHRGSRAFPCDRDVVRLALWREYALLLSADTDCLSLWDEEGLVRTARVGVYPQDMALSGDVAYVCGGADCRLHALTLPSLYGCDEVDLPGMPERIAIHQGLVHLLMLQTEPELRTLLAAWRPADGTLHRQMVLPGIPGALTASADGLWIGATGQAAHLPYGAAAPDVLVDGVGLPERIDVFPDGVTITDGLTGRRIRLHHRNEKERSSCDERS